MLVAPTFIMLNFFSEPPVIIRNNKTSEVAYVRHKHKKRYSTLVGSSISSPASIALTIICAAKGKPAPTIEWTRNGKTVVRSKNVKILSRGRLRIKSLSSKEIGRYECTASNDFGVDRAVSNINIKSKLMLMRAEISREHVNERKK